MGRIKIQIKIIQNIVLYVIEPRGVIPEVQLSPKTLNVGPELTTYTPSLKVRKTKLIR